MHRLLLPGLAATCAGQEVSRGEVRPIVIAGLVCAAVAAGHLAPARAAFGHWLQVHTGTVNEPGPYYGFWSGFGSDLGEFGILGAVGVGRYSLVKNTTVTNRAAGGSATTPRRTANSTSVTATTRTSRAGSHS